MAAIIFYHGALITMTIGHTLKFALIHVNTHMYRLGLRIGQCVYDPKMAVVWLVQKCLPYNSLTPSCRADDWTADCNLRRGLDGKVKTSTRDAA